MAQRCTSGLEPAAMLNWRGLALNLFGTRAPHLVLPVVVALDLMSVGWLLWCWWRTRTGRDGPDALPGTDGVGIRYIQRDDKA